MIDLIEKIHELKDYENYDYDQAITDVEILLDQYNIITAPKTIKLSDIVSMLKDFECYLTDYNVCRERNEIIIECYHYSFIECLHGENIIIRNNRISDIKAPVNKYFKWLYALWIAGTVIEDDLKEE